jgi:hypothetical protein
MMRVVVCRGDGTVADSYDVDPGRTFVLSLDEDDYKAAVVLMSPAAGWRVAVVRDVLDVGDRLMIGWALAAQFGWFVQLGAAEASWFGAGFFVALALPWALMLRRTWRATA